MKKKTKSKEKENYSLYMLTKDWGKLSNLPGVDNNRAFRVLPLIIREDGYQYPTKPMTKFQWKLRFFLAFFCEWIGRNERYDEPGRYIKAGEPYFKS